MSDMAGALPSMGPLPSRRIPPVDEAGALFSHHSRYSPRGGPAFDPHFDNEPIPPPRGYSRFAEGAGHAADGGFADADPRFAGGGPVSPAGREDVSRGRSRLRGGHHTSGVWAHDPVEAMPEFGGGRHGGRGSMHRGMGEMGGVTGGMEGMERGMANGMHGRTGGMGDGLGGGGVGGWI